MALRHAALQSCDLCVLGNLDKHVLLSTIVADNHATGEGSRAAKAKRVRGGSLPDVRCPHRSEQICSWTTREPRSPHSSGAAAATTTTEAEALIVG